MQLREVTLGRRVNTLWPRYEPVAMASEGELTAASGGTSLTLNGVGNTKPATWTQVVASTSQDADGFFVQLQVGNTGIGDFLIDVGLGGAGSEVTIVTNILFSHGNGDGFPAMAFFPIPIPAGSRIAMRMQSTDTASVGVAVILNLVNGGVAARLKCRTATTYGADTSDSGGTAVDAGGSTNTKGAWSQLSASVTSTFEQCIVCIGQRNNAANTSQNILLDLGVGAALSEVVVLPDIYLRVSAGEEINPHMFWVPLRVFAGQRLAARIQSSSNDATDRVIDVTVIGFS